MAGTLTYNKVIWLPHLILQRSLGVKDLRAVNFNKTLVQPSFAELEAWQPKENKPDPSRVLSSGMDDLDNERGQFFDNGAREPSLIVGGEISIGEDGLPVQELIPVRGEAVFFKYKGYDTFLFQEEYDLISEVLPLIREITIQTTNGLSPLFKVLAVLQKD